MKKNAMPGNQQTEKKPDQSKLSARRSFLQHSSFTLLAALPAAIGIMAAFKTSLAHAADAAAGKGGAAPAAGSGKLEMVKETDPQAQALGYREDAKKVDVKKYPKRAGPEGAKQFCHNCVFFQSTAADPKSTPAAPCQILGMKGVKSGAWCNTWTQNPKLKS